MWLNKNRKVKVGIEFVSTGAIKSVVLITRWWGKIFGLDQNWGVSEFLRIILSNIMQSNRRLKRTDLRTYAHLKKLGWEKHYCCFWAVPACAAIFKNNIKTRDCTSKNCIQKNLVQFLDRNNSLGKGKKIEALPHFYPIIIYLLGGRGARKRFRKSSEPFFWRGGERERGREKLKLFHHFQCFPFRVSVMITIFGISQGLNPRDIL